MDHYNVVVLLLLLCVRDLRKFKEVKKQFDKASEEKEAALVKNAQVPRNKQHEVDEATDILSSTRKCFRHIALDYVLQVRGHLHHNQLLLCNKSLESSCESCR